jgi:predicted lipid-binding transport protein (Tim44 family)
MRPLPSDPASDSKLGSLALGVVVGLAGAAVGYALAGAFGMLVGFAVGDLLVVLSRRAQRK